MSELKLADLGEGMHEAEVVEWLGNVGDTVKLDQTVVKVETDKAIVEIPAPVAGRVVDIDKVGTSVRQGGLIAKLQEGNRTTEIRSPITGSTFTR